MTKERIEDMREVVLPFITKKLKEINYEGKGKSDAEEFTKDFNEILDLAIKALNIDKMIAEIEHIKERDNCTFDCIDAVDEVLDIINKYCKGDRCNQ